MTNAALEILNEALETDARAMESFIGAGTSCSDSRLARYGDIIIRGDNCLTALGFLNSVLVKAGHNRVCAVYDHDNKLTAFREVI